MPNVAMWVRALRVIPRIDKREWDALDLVSRWLVATRSATLALTLVSASVAGLCAARAGRFDGAVWLVVAAGLVFAHATNNLVNDLVDHAKGVDRGDYFRARYGPQPLEHGLMTRAELCAYAAVTGAVAAAAGAYLVWLRGAHVLALAGAGAFFVLFYTWPLKYVGLGEIAVLAVWGPLMVGGGAWVVAGAFDAGAVWASLPFGLAATSVLMGKHVDKLDADRAKGIRTLPVLLGERAARGVTAALIVSAYAVVVALVATGSFGWPILLVALAARPLYFAMRVFANARPAEPPPRLPRNVWPLWYAAFAFHHARRFGLLYVAGLGVEVLLRTRGPST